MDFIALFDELKWKTLAQAQALFADCEDADALEAQAFLALFGNLYTAGEGELTLSFAENTTEQTIDLLRRAAASRGGALDEMGEIAILYALLNSFFSGGSILQFFSGRRVRLSFSAGLNSDQESLLLDLAEELCSRSFSASLYRFCGLAYNGNMQSETESAWDTFAPFVSGLREDTIRRNADAGDVHAARRYALLLKERKDTISKKIRTICLCSVLPLISFAALVISLPMVLMSWFVPIEIEDDGTFIAQFFLENKPEPTPLLHYVIFLLIFLLNLALLFSLGAWIHKLIAKRNQLFHHYSTAGNLSENQGQYIPQPDSEKAEQYLKKAYLLNESYAWIYAEFLHYDAKRSDEAKEILSRAIERNDTNAMLSMRSLFLYRPNPNAKSLIMEMQRLSRARDELLQKAADLGNRSAIIMLAESSNRKEKREHYERAAALGSDDARVWMSQKLARGSWFYHIKKDPAKAFEYAQKAAIFGHPDGLAQLGWCYEHGVGVPKQPEKAVKCYLDALKNGGNSFFSLAGIRLFFFEFFGRFDPLQSALVSIEGSSDRTKEKAVWKGALNGTISLEEGSKTYAELAAESETSREELLHDEAEFIAYIKKQEELTKFHAAQRHPDEYSQSEEFLKQRFGDEWNRLSEDAQVCLISARTLLLSTEKYEAKGFDYSGVSITAGSALEHELKRVFYLPLVQRFKEKYGNHWYDWPGQFFKYPKKRKGEDDFTEFTLGKLPYILGCKFPEKHEFNGEQKSVVADYLKQIIREDTYTEQPLDALTKPIDLPGMKTEKTYVDLIDDICNRHRNPAAHTHIVHREEALDCYRAVAGAEDDISRVESALDILLFLLKP